MIVHLNNNAEEAKTEINKYLQFVKLAELRMQYNAAWMDFNDCKTKKMLYLRKLLLFAKLDDDMLEARNCVEKIISLSRHMKDPIMEDIMKELSSFPTILEEGEGI